MKTLAIDIGLRNTGWAIVYKNAVIDCGCIKTGKDKKKKVSLDNMDNVMYITGELDAVLNKHQPEVVVAELPTGGGKSSRAVIAMALSSAIVACLAQLRKKKIVWVSPTQAKKDFINQRTGDKDLTMAKVRELWPNYDWPKYKNTFEHIADAMQAWYSADKNNLL